MLKNFSIRLARWIPGHVSVKFIVFVYRIMALFGFSRKSVRKSNYEHNIETLSADNSPLKEGFIENQPAWTAVRFGKTDMAFAGCEIMAVYNVLLALGKEGGAAVMAKLISYFERRGAALQGRIGTSPAALAKYLMSQGIRARVVWKEEELDSSAKATIVTMYNNYHDLYDQIHTVAYNHDGADIVSHNSWSDSKRYGNIRDAVRGSGEYVKMICAIEILE